MPAGCFQRVVLHKPHPSSSACRSPTGAWFLQQRPPEGSFQQIHTGVEYPGSSRRSQFRTRVRDSQLSFLSSKPLSDSGSVSISSESDSLTPGSRGNTDVTLLEALQSRTLIQTLQSEMSCSNRNHTKLCAGMLDLEDRTQRFHYVISEESFLQAYGNKCGQIKQRGLQPGEDG